MLGPMAHPTKALIRDAGGLAAEYRALVDGAGLADRSGAGRLRITGADALDLLNRLTTNELEELPDGRARLTVLTNGDARVIDVLALASVDGGTWCLTSPGRADAVIDWLDTYTFGEDIAVADRTAETVQLTLAGPEAARVLAAAGVTGAPAVTWAALDHVAQVTIAGASVVLWHTLTGGAEGFEVIAERSAGDGVGAALVAAGATPVSAGAWETFRIANGMPAYGLEFGEANNPLESRLRGAISEDKGCYTGQEVIARLLTYRKVQRRLMAVALSAPAQAGADLLAGGARAGTLTSVADVPGGGRVGLALVAHKRAVAGSAFEVAGAAGVTATLSEPAYALATEPVD